MGSGGLVITSVANEVLEHQACGFHGPKLRGNRQEGGLDRIWVGGLPLAVVNWRLRQFACSASSG